MLGRKYPQARSVGLCHGYRGVYHLASEIGLPDNQFTFEIPGVNHFVFLTQLFNQGQDALPLIRKWVDEKAAQYWDLRSNISDDLGPKQVDLYRRLGVSRLAIPPPAAGAPGRGGITWMMKPRSAGKRIPTVGTSAI